MAKDLAQQLDNALNSYLQTVTSGAKGIVEDLAKEMLEKIRDEAPEKSGKYKKAMRLKTGDNTAYSLSKIWYVAKPHYRLTHLLENGHAMTDASGNVHGVAPPRPHIAPAYEWAIGELDDRLKRSIEDASK